MKAGVLVVLLLMSCGPSAEERYGAAIRDLQLGKRQSHAMKVIERHWRDKFSSHGDPFFRYGVGPITLAPEHYWLRERLLQLLSSSDDEEVERAAETLEAMRAPADHRLVECALRRTTLSNACLDTLLVVGDPQWLDALARRVNDQTNSYVVGALILLELRGIPYLETALVLSDAKHCTEIISALEGGAWGREVRPGHQPDPLLRPRALAVLRKSVSHPDVECRRYALHELVGVDGDLETTLAPLVNDPAPDVRDSARRYIERERARKRLNESP